MSTKYKSSADVPTKTLAGRLKELADVVAQKRDLIDAEFTLRVPAECDRDADLVMYEAAVRLESLQSQDREEIVEMALCESRHLVLRIGQAYRFTPIAGCKTCEEMRDEQEQQE